MIADSHGDRYLSHSSRHTQVPVPATILSYGSRILKDDLVCQFALRHFLQVNGIVDDFQRLRPHISRNRLDEEGVEQSLRTDLSD